MYRVWWYSRRNGPLGQRIRRNGRQLQSYS
nr:MAG TPA: hypothetical protein [Caudoviricetes sp.]